MDVAAGHLHERVLQVGRIEVQVGGGDTGRCQGENHRARQFRGPGDDDVLAIVLDAAHSGEVCQQPVIERRGRREPHPLGHPGPVGQALRGIDGDDAPAVDHGHLVTQPLGLVHVVGHQDDGDPAVADVLDQLPGVAAGLRVQAGGHLIQHRDPGITDERQRDRDPLLEPAGQGLVVVVRLLGQLQGAYDLFQVGRVPVEGVEQIQDLAHLQLRGKGAGLQLSAHDRVQALAVPVRVQAHDPDQARVGIPQPDHALDGGGLPPRSGPRCRRPHLRRPRTRHHRPQPWPRTPCADARLR